MLSNDNKYIIGKYLIPKIRLRCPTHSKEQAQYICTDNMCKHPSIICKSCQSENEKHFNDHKNSMKKIDDYLVDITNDMEIFTPTNRQILQEVYSESPNLQKWQDDDQMHLINVEKHISAQKIIIGDDMNTLSSHLLSNLDSIREKIFKELDSFYRKYCETFNKQKTSLNENFGLAKNFYHYINPSNLAAKLQSEMPSLASQFVSQLNKSIDKAKQIQQNKQTFVQNFKAINQKLNKMTDNLPFYRPSDQMNQQVKSVINLIESFFSKNINLSEDGEQLQNNNNNNRGLQQYAQQPSQQSPSPSSSKDQNIHQINKNNMNNMVVGNFAHGAASPIQPQQNNYNQNNNNNFNIQQVNQVQNQNNNWNQ